MIKGLIYHFILLILITLSGNGFSQDIRQNSNFDNALIKIKESKGVSYERKRTLLAIHNKDTSFDSFKIFRLRISDSVFFFKIIDENSSKNKLVFIKDSTGCYFYGSQTRILERPNNLDTIFMLNSYPYFELFGISSLNEYSSRWIVDSISNMNYIIYSIDSSENPNAPGLYIRQKFYQNRTTNIFDKYEEDVWAKNYHQFIIDMINIIDDQQTDIYNLIARKNTMLDVVFEINTSDIPKGKPKKSINKKRIKHKD